MAQSCDRIVFGLRKKGIQIDILHLTHYRALKDAAQQGGNYYCRALGDDISHSLNLIWNDLQSLNVQWTHVCAFGGYVSMLSAPIYAKWLNASLITHIRGNDFDSGIFSPKKREILEKAILDSRAVAVVSQDKVSKIKSLYPEVNAKWTPNGIDLENWSALPSDLKKSEQLKSKACGENHYWPLWPHQT